MKNLVEDLKKDSNNGIVYQIVDNYTDYGDSYFEKNTYERIKVNPYISVEIWSVKVTMPLDDFKNNLLEYLVAKNYEPNASVEGLAFNSRDIINSVVEESYTYYYYDLNGNFLGNDYSVLTPIE